jgi:[NiFe] hydrogenase diaphorase moiety large subunit
MNSNIKLIIEKYGNDSSRLLDLLIEIQENLGYISNEAIVMIAEEFDMAQVDVEQTLSFFHFFTRKPAGEYTVYLNNSVVANMNGREEVAKAFEREAGCKFGSVSEDGLIGLFETADIGMNDQEPAALINGKVFTNLDADKVHNLVKDFKKHKKVEDLIETYGEGMNSHKLIKSMVNNNIRKKGAVLFAEHEPFSALKKAVKMSSKEVIEEVKESNIRGRGGGGFPAGMKWEFCSKTSDNDRFLIANADEGEPGTFKDRVLLTEYPKLLFEGMVIAAYAIGCKSGFVYLRSEYTYLKNYLNTILDEMRQNNLLGENILGVDGFNFDIRIQSGAGAYVCGEVSALIESSEGKRGEPRNKPPNTVKFGYLGKPTVANNVETLSSIPKIILNGGKWYKTMGTAETSGTKLLSISGDCRYPGVYEVEWGMTIRDMLKMCGADRVSSVQAGGPSGECLSLAHFGRKIAYEDVSTGGSMTIFGKNRDLIRDVITNYTDFFIEESCGSCAPCRNIPVLLRNKLKKILNGEGVFSDIDDMLEWGTFMKVNRCGLGQAAANPVISSIRNFRDLYKEKILTNDDFVETFDLEKATREARELRY